MKQPTLEFEGLKYKVSGVHWNEDGALAHVAFTDSKGQTEVAFQLYGKVVEGFNDDGHLYLDLYKRLKVGE